MTRLYALVEGHTEAQLMKEVVAPHLQRSGVWLYAIVVETSRDATGRKRQGGGHWKQWRRDLMRLAAQQPAADVRFTTMFDLYGLPKDFPSLAALATQQDTHARAAALEAAMAQDVAERRLVPYLQRHELEALVLAALQPLRELLDAPEDLAGVDRLVAELDALAPEDVNDGPETAPSKRLERYIPGYRKPLHGPLALAGAGLETLRRACPRFDAWIARLEALGDAPR